jgi:CP family cyanate transporter-like MFS transporter
MSEVRPPMVTIPLLLPLVGGSWEWSFAVWSIPVAMTLLLLVTATPHRPRERAAEAYRWWPDWHGALPLGMLLGGTGGLYFLGNTFIPDPAYHRQSAGDSGIIFLKRRRFSG